ncbi:hypothetical protein CONLIGDRAFT_685894 [Coniochaeta ligniaria NRRL 30616]|uniref:Uncharacterized protein n=1 Tax=Coniochaeta ligniaria NRRL 30616 TaxID=1408157 RepID=A0A1J7J371_9PEZI|nr:hypothetical protein CONLIGDRAFT_685894 [Coniochaeta ligniaria NRRL 30616]
MAFQERLYSFPHAENRILSLFNTLMSGSALIWRNSELSTQDRRDLQNEGRLPVVLDAHRQRFRQGPAMATAKLLEGKLYLSDLTEYNTGNPDLGQLSILVQKKLRHVRQMGLLDGAGDSWQTVVAQLYSQIDLQIGKYLPAPTRKDGSLAAYSATFQSTKLILAAAVMDLSHERADGYNGTLLFCIAATIWAAGEYCASSHLVAAK